MSIRIITDSTCDLPLETLNALGIQLIPNYVHINGQAYRELIDITHNDLYHQLADLSNQIYTSPSPTEDIRQIFASIPPEDEILCIVLSSSLSKTVEHVTLAAQASERKVTIHDSKFISMGLGYQVLAAAKVIHEGGTVAQAIQAMNSMLDRTFMYVLLDTLEFLKRGGRVSSVTATVGGFLQIKPILKLQLGKIESLDKQRTYQRGFKKFLQYSKFHGKLNRLTVVHANAPQRAEEVKRTLASIVSTDIRVTDVSPSLGVHIGPKAVSVIGVMPN